MAPSMQRLTGWLVWIAIAIGGASPVAGLDAFRVDTEMFKDQDKKPFSEQLTIFTEGGIVYDFCLTPPHEATVFDSRRGVFTLLDESRRVKATVATQELLDFTLALETHAAQQKHSLFAFCATPKFETTEKEIDKGGQTLVELKLTARPLTFIAEGQRVERPEAVKAYRHYADWCARLNATCGNLPPSARLALNQAFAERDLLPLEVTRIIPPDLPLGKKSESRSQHRVNWTLSGEDQKKIEHASDMIATFELVSFDDFRGVGKPAAVKQARR